MYRYFKTYFTFDSSPKSCPGETKCREKGLGLSKIREEELEEKQKLCRNCKFYWTKLQDLPEILKVLTAVPDEEAEEVEIVFQEGMTITEFFKAGHRVIPDKERIILRSESNLGMVADGIFQAFDLSALKESGATFNYPESLTFFEWVCLKAYSSGFNRAHSEDMEKKKK